ncbi:oligogalacturonate lyase family protein [Brevibacillus dissolubilis]|uniref:oligogalacturonate lyase family protein n=1 Tax=Brevibacillus dissolubilis TaxID=1844116 RepID=UPI001C3F216A|nr:oligogalacturonate lyase family protein [Brevibacillus dissolubilis]
MIGKQYPSELKRYADEKTGRTVIQLTSGDSNNYHLYFTDNSFTTGDQEIYFLSDRASDTPEIYNMFKMDLNTGIITQVTDEAEGIIPTSHTKSPDSELVVYVTGKQIKLHNTRTNETTVVYEEKGDVHLGHPFLSPNKKYIGLARNENVPIKRGANYSGFKETMYAIKKGWITLIDLEDGRVFDVFEDTHWLGHFQFAPDDSNLAMFCHEGPWNLVHQRIWLLDITTGKVKPCFRQEEDDCVGHEFWTSDGNVFFDNRRKGHDGTITSDKTQAIVTHVESDQIPYIGFADKNGEVLSIIDLPYYCNHYHANNDNTLLVGDEVEDLVLIHLGGDKPTIETLCTHQTSWYTQQTHCHPTFSWDNSKILYASDRDGKINLYLIDMNP